MSARVFSTGTHKTHKKIIKIALKWCYLLNRKGGYIVVITAIFTSVATVITGYSSVMLQAFTSVGAAFYDETSGLTVLGGLLTLGIGAGLIYFGFRLIKALIKHRGA